MALLDSEESANTTSTHFYLQRCSQSQWSLLSALMQCPIRVFFFVKPFIITIKVLVIIIALDGRKKIIYCVFVLNFITDWQCKKCLFLKGLFSHKLILSYNLLTFVLFQTLLTCIEMVIYSKWPCSATKWMFHCLKWLYVPFYNIFFWHLYSAISCYFITLHPSLLFVVLYFWAVLHHLSVCSSVGFAGLVT